MDDNKYTQREWDRTVGIGKVPDKYAVEESNKFIATVSETSVFLKDREDIKNTDEAYKYAKDECIWGADGDTDIYYFTIDIDITTVTEEED